MRPLQVKMSGFGPYAGEVCIDMAKLGERGPNADIFNCSGLIAVHPLCRPLFQ